MAEPKITVRDFGTVSRMFPTIKSVPDGYFRGQVGLITGLFVSTHAGIAPLNSTSGFFPNEDEHGHLGQYREGYVKNIRVDEWVNIHEIIVEPKRF